MSKTLTFPMFFSGISIGKLKLFIVIIATKIVETMDMINKKKPSHNLPF